MNLNPPVISIVLPTFNRAYCLDRAIGSVLSQTESCWELIIVDNHSTDNTLELIKSYDDCRIHHITFSNNGVVAASRNQGIKNCKGDFVAFLDSDDWWAPKKLEYALSALREGADLVYHELYSIDFLPVSEKKSQLIQSRGLNEPAFDDLLYNGNTILNSSVVVRRELMDSIGGFSEEPEIIAAEDYYGWLMISQRTDKFVKLSEPLGYYWSGGDNLSSPSKTLTCNRYLTQVFESTFDKRGTPGWIDYTNARAYLALSEYRQSIDCAWKSLSSCRTLYLKIKTVFTLLQAVSGIISHRLMIPDGK